MASSKKRQRKLAREKVNRQIQRRADAARRRRRWRAGVGGAVVLALVVVGAVWAMGGFKSAPKKVAVCDWTTRQDATNPNIKDVGKPPTSGIPTSGTRIMTVTTNLGVIEIELDVTKAPCAAASLTYLAGKTLDGKKYFQDKPCNQLITLGTFALMCGSPEGTEPGQVGGPSYTFRNENVPAGPPSASASAAASPGESTPAASATTNSAAPTSTAAATSASAASPGTSASTTPANVRYPRGTVGLFNTDSSPTGSPNGSTFFISYGNDWQMQGEFSIIGKVISGLEIVDKVAEGGVQNDVNGEPTTNGKPKTEIKIQTLTVGPVKPATPSPAPGGSVPPSSPVTSATAAPSATGSSKP